MIPIIQTLGDREVALTLARAQEMNVRARQNDARVRLLMLQENWRHIVWAYINGIYKTPAVKESIRRRVKGTFNVLQQICNRVCVAYKVPPIRTLKDASEASQQELAKIVKESKLVTRAKKWERRTFAMNVVITVPRVREDVTGSGKRLDYETITPDRCEVYTDNGDPLGDPVRIVYTCKDTADYTPDPMATVVLDDQAFHYFDSRGRRVAAPVVHGAGIFPGTVWRASEPDDDDWWDSHRGSGLVDATIEVAHLAARMDWVRHGQDRYREYAISAEMSTVPNQVAGAEGPQEVPLAPNAFRADALNINTSIDNHLAHIKAYLHQAAESIGVPSVLVDFDMGATNYSNVTGLATAHQHEALGELRASYIEFYREAEEDSAWKTALVLRGMGHPSARLLAPDMVKESFAITYPELTFVQEPLARATVSEKRIQLGLSSTIREYHAAHPELTFDQAREQVIAIAKEEGEINELYIQGNRKRGEANKMNLAQMQGQQGGIKSGEERQPEDDDDDDSSSRPGRADSDDDSE